MTALFTKLCNDESGATMIEYALMVALIAIVLIATINATTGALAQTFTRITNALNAAS